MESNFDLSGKDVHSHEEITKVWSEEQSRIKAQIITHDEYPSIEYIGGVDISFNKQSDTHGYAYLTVLRWPSLQQIYNDSEQVECDKPYIAGFLAFREVSFLKVLVDRLKNNNKEIMPQVILVDGNGVLHKRGCGLASHLGIVCGVATIGVAKKLYAMLGISKDGIKEWKQQMKGSKEECRKKALVGSDGVTYGMALMAHKGINDPVYVSVGHRVGLDSAVEIVRACSIYRVPQPIRLADLQSRQMATKLTNKQNNIQK